MDLKAVVSQTELDRKLCLVITLSEVKFELVRRLGSWIKWKQGQYRPKVKLVQMVLFAKIGLNDLKTNMVKV